MEADLEAMRLAAQETTKQLELQSQKIFSLESELTQLKAQNAHLQGCEARFILLLVFY